jgi:two-component system, NtrC family, response regulator HydG
MEKKASILVVDDDRGTTETLSDILEEIGYEVSTANDGYQAIEMIKERSFDVALMDIKMPGINGVETFKRAAQINPNTRVIMMTAYSLEDLVQEALAGGAFGVMYKPLNMEKVIEFVDRAEKGAFILVVDDDPKTCETIKDVLEEKLFKVGIAHSGEEAIEYVKKNNIEFVLIDVKMPVLNGLDTYLEIKKINPRITAVMMTGYRQEMADLVQEALNNKAYTCFYKPLSMDQLIAALDEVVRKKHAEK